MHAAAWRFSSALYSARYHETQPQQPLHSPFATPTAATPALEALGKSLSDAERAAFRQQLLARAAAAQDPCFHDALYATLVQLR